ncbi:UNVERIFIED_CONTAM: hypothetical protein RMT77_012111 [Armadillidium vulgare]
MPPNPINDLIRDAEFEILTQNIDEYFKNVTSGKEIEQILHSCCQFLYKTSTLSENTLSSMTKAVTAYIDRANKDSIILSKVVVLKSLYYILVYGVRKGLNQIMILNLVEKFQSFLSNCEDFPVNHSDLLKKLYSTLWNTSLQKEISPQISFTLQSHSVGLLTLVIENFTDACNQTYYVGKLAERNGCSKEDIGNMYERVLIRLTETLKRKPTINSNTIISLTRILIEYGSCLYIIKKCNKFSKVFRPMIALLDPLYKEEVILSLKMAVKVVEVAISYASDQCSESILTKILSGCSAISRTSEVTNVILLESLHYVYQLFNENKLIKKLQSGLYSVFDCITERIQPDSKFASDSLLKIMETFGNHLNHFVTLLTSSPSDKMGLFIKIDNCSSSLSILLPKIENLKGEAHIYNIGVICCNLGVIAFQGSNYDLAAKLLDFGVKYLYINYSMCSEIQKSNVLSIIKKKATLLKDSLRYCGKYKEAALKTFHFVAVDVFQVSELLPTWIKCKRDAMKKNSQALKNVCIGDLYLEAQNDLEVKCTDINIEELILEEIKELKQLSFDTTEAESYCAKTLMASTNPLSSLEGYLAYSKILWSNSDLVSEHVSPIKMLNEALKIIDTFPKSLKENGVAFEYKARIMFWLYLCNLQIIQEKAEQEVEKEMKSDNLRTVQATNLGEEVQPNDVCSIRPAASVATFDSQDKNLVYLDQALELWKIAIKLTKPRKPTEACSDLQSIGFIYKLSGILPSTVKAFTLLLKMANKCDLNKFWIIGVTELMDIIPELISTNVAKQIEDLIKYDESAKEKNSEYFQISTLASLAYFYLRKGELKPGLELIEKCLESSLMKQRTPTATEIQIMIYYVASQYSFLPKSMLPNTNKKHECTLFLAMNATRKSIGLLKASFDDEHKIVCYRHKIAWLHHMTNMWLGRLCHMTAQPRLARAYLRQALTVSEKLALSIRTVELLCTLSEIDLQCDQLDDCAIKIDSIENLFKSHCPSNKKANLGVEDTSMIKSSKRKGKMGNYLELPCNTKIRNDVSHLIPIYVDDENMRENESNQDFELKELSSQLGNQLLIIGKEERIDELAHPSVGFASPKEKYFVRSFSSRCKVGDICPVCITPELSSVVVRSYTLLGVVYAHKDNLKNSKNSFRQAEKELDKLFTEYNQVIKYLDSILSTATSSWGSIINENIEEKNNFINYHMFQAKLSLMFHRNETMCLDEGNFKSMEYKIKETLEEIDSFNSVILASSHPYVLQIILQCHSIDKALKQCNEREENDQASEEYSPTTCTPFRTPVKSSIKTGFKSMQTIPSVTRPVCTPFRIFKDKNCGWPSPIPENVNETPKQGTKVQKEKEIKILSSSSFKTSQNTRVKLDFSNDLNTSRSSNDLSPFKQVLELPSIEFGVSDTVSSKSKRGIIVNTKDDVSTVTTEKPKKTYSRKKISNHKEKSTVEKPDEEVKENSPTLVKTKAKTTTLRSKTTSTKRATKDSTATVTSTRETRSRRNLQRL